MMKPFDFLMQLARKNVDTTKENNKFIFGDSDKIIIWLVGFSFAGISLILSNIEDLYEHFGCLVVKSVLILFALTCILGIINRISGFYLRILLSQIQIFIENAFGNETVIGLNDSFDIDSETDFKIIFNRLINNFHVVPEISEEQYKESNNQTELLRVTSTFRWI